MAELDPFSAQIVKLVRNMPDEALLELVRNQLNLTGSSAGARARAARNTLSGMREASGALASAGGEAKGRAARQSPDARKQLLSSVESTVKSSQGLSASEVAKKLKAPQSRIAAALRELKQSKRIYQGGDRRFARYAADARTAKQASISARTSPKKS